MKGILSKEAWLANKNTIKIDTSSDTFSTEELSNVKVSMVEQGLFYYPQLTDEEKEVFNYVFLAVKNRKRAISFETPIPVDVLTKAIYIMKFDCPELYYLGDTFDYDLQGKKVTVFYPTYVLSEHQYNRMQKRVDSKVNEILEQISELSEYDAEYFVHNYLTNFTEYTTETSNCDNMYGCLVENQANCEGYSSAFLYILRKLGIESTQVIGSVEYNGEQVGHSWNMVNIDNEYYYIDVAWDDLDPIPEYSDTLFHYAFFNITYDEMVAERNISKNLEYLGNLPESNALSNNYFYKTKTYATSMEEAKNILFNKIPAVVSSKDKYFMLKCNSKELYDELLEEITPTMQSIINKYNLPIKKCSYIKIENGYTLIIHNFVYNN